ncbi:MAG: hypothetical protein CPDRYMAC_3884 [uncultured Paraburkholderia sp.]|nr:MAG: hypothetical protein CPDRYDRY_3748 [uncultured Paraburkholderia sp.]CAH2933393.1 MAG: hypothetical protein CPDRYMAC_3884 [uncultured Paraburkholderia sp.]
MARIACDEAVSCQPITEAKSDTMKKRFDRKLMVSVTGVWLALAIGGCANVGQQGAQERRGGSGFGCDGCKCAGCFYRQQQRRERRARWCAA